MLIALPGGKKALLHRKPNLDSIGAREAVIQHNNALAAQVIQEDYLRETPCKQCRTPHCCRMPTTLTQLEAWTIHVQAHSSMNYDRLVAKHHDEHLWHEAGCCLTAEQNPERCPALHPVTNACMVYAYRPIVCSMYFAPSGYTSDKCRPAFGSSTPMVMGGFLTRARISAAMLSASWLPSDEWLQFSGMATTMLWMDGELPHPTLVYVSSKAVWLSMDSGSTWNKTKEVN